VGAADGGGEEVRAFAPGRVNVIGDHTDYTGGLCLPMAIHLGTTVTGRRTGDVVELRSADEALPAVVPVDVAEPAAVEPFWARYVAGVVREVRPPVGLVGSVSTTVPIGAGLSSSAAFEVALALALGFEGSVHDLARACQRAENAATGVPTGILDQLTSAGGVDGHALVMDCTTLSLRPVPWPDEVEVVVVHSGQERSLAASGYAQRVRECAAAEAVVGPLRLIGDEAPLAAIADPVVRRRARHVVTENARVRAFADALAAGDLPTLGALMRAGHASLRDDYEVSTPVVDALVAHLDAVDGVLGTRMTGGGFGGCVVALTRPGALASLGSPGSPGTGWVVRPGPGASLA
jgi:galactokinase